jgi:hypothetical protein
MCGFVWLLMRGLGTSCLQPDVGVMLQHPPGQMTVDRLLCVIRDTHLGKLGDDCMPKIMEAQAGKLCFGSRLSPDPIPFLGRRRLIDLAPLAGVPSAIYYQWSKAFLEASNMPGIFARCFAGTFHCCLSVTTRFHIISQGANWHERWHRQTG